MANTKFENTQSNYLCEWAVVAGAGMKGMNPGFFGMESKGDGYERN